MLIVEIINIRMIDLQNYNVFGLEILLVDLLRIQVFQVEMLRKELEILVCNLRDRFQLKIKLEIVSILMMFEGIQWLRLIKRRD